MTPLRQKMIRAMELRNLAKNTQRGYLTAVTGITRHYQQSPDTLTQQMIEFTDIRYLLVPSRSIVLLLFKNNGIGASAFRYNAFRNYSIGRKKRFILAMPHKWFSKLSRNSFRNTKPLPPATSKTLYNTHINFWQRECREASEP